MSDVSNYDGMNEIVRRLKWAAQLRAVAPGWVFNHWLFVGDKYLWSVFPDSRREQGFFRLGDGDDWFTEGWQTNDLHAMEGGQRYDEAEGDWSSDAWRPIGWSRDCGQLNLN